VPAHKEIREVAHSPQQLFDLVSDIESYPEFLPWCIGVRIKERGTAGENKTVVADVLISYKMFREKFRSRVELDPVALTINVEYLSGPFKHLNNYWRFEPNGEGARVDFSVDFEFKNRLLERMVAGLFDRAVRKVVSAFFDRADALYADPPSPPG